MVFYLHGQLITLHCFACPSLHRELLVSPTGHNLWCTVPQPNAAGARYASQYEALSNILPNESTEAYGVGVAGRRKGTGLARSKAGLEDCPAAGVVWRAGDPEPRRGTLTNGKLNRCLSIGVPRRRSQDSQPSSTSRRIFSSLQPLFSNLGANQRTYVKSQ